MLPVAEVGEASQKGLATSRMMIQMFIGSAARPQWFSIVTFTPTFSPWSASSRNDSMALRMWGTTSLFIG